MAAGIVLGLVRDTRRVSRALHVLQGRPLAYRVNLEDGALVIRGGDHARVEDCSVIHRPLPPCEKCGTPPRDNRVGVRVT